MPEIIGHYPRHSVNGAHNKAGVSLQGLNGSESNSHDRAMRPYPKQSCRQSESELPARRLEGFFSLLGQLIEAFFKIEACDFELGR